MWPPGCHSAHSAPDKSAYAKCVSCREKIKNRDFCDRLVVMTQISGSRIRNRKPNWIIFKPKPKPMPKPKPIPKPMPKPIPKPMPKPKPKPKPMPK